jgi:hypothetical protein
LTKSGKLILVNLFVFGLTAPLASPTQAQTYQSGTDIPTQFKSATPGSCNTTCPATPGNPGSTGNPASGSALGQNGAIVDRMYFCSPTTTTPGLQPLEPTYSVPVAQSGSSYSAYSFVTNSTGGTYSVTGTGNNAGKTGATAYVNVSVYASQSVQGSARYGVPSFRTTLTSTTRRFQGNGIPSIATGIFPVRPNDPAYPYYSPAVVQAPWNTADKIPITPYQLDITVPRNPTYNNTPQCINLQKTLIVGVSLYGDTFHHNIATSTGTNAVDPVTVKYLAQ